MSSLRPATTRRRLLRAGLAAVPSALAGCLGAGGNAAPVPDTTTDEPRPGGSTADPDRGMPATTMAEPTRRADGGNTATSPERETATAADAGRLTLPSVATTGSPGGPIDVHPPGQAVLLDFFATWCAPCGPEMANLRAVRDRFDHGSVFVISVTQETDQAAIVRFWNRYDGAWPVAMDPNLSATRAYDVVGVPTIAVFAADGTAVLRHVGLAGEDRLVRAVESALDGAADA